MARWWNIPPRNWKDNTRTCLKSQVGHTRKRARGQSQRKPFPSGYRDPGQAHQRTAEPAGTGSQRRLRSRSLPRGGRLRGERLRKVPREIGSSNEWHSEIYKLLLKLGIDRCRPPWVKVKDW